jgi:hypothetical protein
MRVLVVGGDVHVWAPAGHFTIHAGEAGHAGQAGARVTWRTPRVANRDHATVGDDDLCLPPPLERYLRDREGVADAIALDGGALVALAYQRPPRLEILEVATGRVALTVALRAAGPRLPGLENDRAWRGDRASDEFEGSGTRGIRLFPSRDGLWVTANESGHVARCSLASGRIDCAYRVPGAPENTVYVAEMVDGVAVGMKWNGRHSDILRLDEAGELVARWPDDHKVRWGMPAPVVVSDSLVTYSDEGPHRGCLALLDGATLHEQDHVKLGDWPGDLHCDGTTFASVSAREVAIGRVREERFAIERIWTMADAMAAAGAPPPERSAHATDDGRGEREWLDRRFAFLSLDGDETILARAETGEIIARGAAGDRVIVPGQAPIKSLVEIFSGPPRRVVMGARDGNILYAQGRELVTVSRATGAEIQRIGTAGRIRRAWLVPGGLVYVEDDPVVRQGFIWRWVSDGGEARELSRSLDRSGSPAVLACSGATVWWCEHSRPAGVYSWALRRWRVGSDETPAHIDLGLQVLALAVEGDVAIIASDKGYVTHLYRVGSDGALEKLSREPLPSFVKHLLVVGGQVVFTEPLSVGKDGRNPPRLHFLDAAGAPRLLVTSAVESITSLQVVGDRLCWLESTDSGASLLGGGSTIESLAAICSVPLPL